MLYVYILDAPCIYGAVKFLEGKHIEDADIKTHEFPQRQEQPTKKKKRKKKKELHFPTTNQSCIHSLQSNRGD